jgi:hypothetical protein
MKTHVIYICHQVLSLKGLCGPSHGALENIETPYGPPFPTTKTSLPLTSGHKSSALTPVLSTSHYGSKNNQRALSQDLDLGLSTGQEDERALQRALEAKFPDYSVELFRTSRDKYRITLRDSFGAPFVMIGWYSPTGTYIPEDLTPSPAVVKKPKLGRWD